MSVTDFVDADLTPQTSKTLQDGFFANIRRTENFVGILYELDYTGAKVLLNDEQKNAVKGLPLGCFLVAIFSHGLREHALEGILLRVVGTADIPQKQEIMEILSHTYIFDFKEESKEAFQLDSLTQYHYPQHSGLACRALGTFYMDHKGALVFGTDIENFLGAHNYKVYKPQKAELGVIANENMAGGVDLLREEIGTLRYASSQSYDSDQSYAPAIYLRVEDIVAKRSAFFGMTRTGKSNTVKIVVSAIEKLNEQLRAQQKAEIGQIVFDVNGEYTFANVQDKHVSLTSLKRSTRLSGLLSPQIKYKSIRMSKPSNMTFTMTIL